MSYNTSPIPITPPVSVESDSNMRVYLEAARRELTSTLLGDKDILPNTLIMMGKFALAGRTKLFSLPETLNDPVSFSAAPWPLYVLLSCKAALEPDKRDAWAQALPAAVAVEIAIAAADILDEIADDDPSPFVAEYGVGQALNTGNLMLVMAQQVLQRNAQGEGGQRAVRSLGALQEMLTEAAIGQHLDMLYESMGVDEVTLEMSAKMVELKAGALMAGAYRIGAIMAGADERVVELLARFGKETGCIAQLANDVQDVLPSEELTDDTLQQKTDLRLRKRTIPIVFALRDDSTIPNALQRAYAEPAGPPSEVDEDALRTAVMEAGGVQFANLIAEVHRQNALEALDELETLRVGAKEVLQPLLPQVG